METPAAATFQLFPPKTNIFVVSQRFSNFPDDSRRDWKLDTHQCLFSYFQLKVRSKKSKKDELCILSIPSEYSFWFLSARCPRGVWRLARRWTVGRKNREKSKIREQTEIIVFVAFEIFEISKQCSRWCNRRSWDGGDSARVRWTTFFSNKRHSSKINSFSSKMSVQVTSSRRVTIFLSNSVVNQLPTGKRRWRSH